MLHSHRDQSMDLHFKLMEKFPHSQRLLAQTETYQYVYDVILVSLLLILKRFHTHCSAVSTVDNEYISVDWVSVYNIGLYVEYVNV